MGYNARDDEIHDNIGFAAASDPRLVLPITPTEAVEMIKLRLVLQAKAEGH